MRAKKLWLCAGLILVGCDDDRVYVGEDKIYQVAMTADTPAAIESEEGGALFIVEQRADLPIIPPTNAELADRMSGVRAYRDLPFPRLPWVERGELEIQIDFTLSNLDDADRDIDVIVNGANEFDEYVPGVTIVEEDPIPLHSQWERRYTVKAKSRITDTVREEDLDEAAVDLATVVNGAPNSDEIVYFENKSTMDVRSMKYIPAVIPGLVAVRLGLRTNRAANLLLEASIRVRDVGDKLADQDAPHMRIEPEPFSPVFPETD
ncbi:MAG TPA: hypothetical protein VFG30_28760 [Polyangiales bacterium]|jgi:hypothetical protein|nr:hypothetical protein [Polyangiales bacterium]